ncbi:MAG: GAF domain-containing protein [Fibrobacter sp.]|nr:GAF domain-containing protein [Fibrobacter sp.]
MAVQREKSDRKVIIVGSGTDAIRLYAALRDSDHWGTISVIDPASDQLFAIPSMQPIDMIINATNDESLTEHMRSLKLHGTDIISNLSARLLFLSGNDSQQNHSSDTFRRQVLTSLQEMRDSAYLTKNKEELLKVILSISLQSLDADTGSIMLIDQKKRCLTIEMAHGLEPRVVNNVRQKIGIGISGRVARSGRPLLITGKVAATDTPIAEDRSDICSAICCPMLIGNEVIGVININSKKRRRIFDHDDISHIRSLASFTADIIKASREYERTVNASFALSVIGGIRDILNLDMPLQERLNLAMMKLVNSLQGKLCNLYWYDPSMQQFLVRASSAFDINLYNTDQVRLNDFFTGRALRTRESFIFNVTIAGSVYKKWFIAHPIIYENTLCGLLMLHVISDRTQFNKERALLEKVAVLLQAALENTSKLETTRRQSIQFGVLSEITFDLAGIHNVRQLAKTIVVNACMILEAESCVLNLYNSTMGCFETFESFSIKGEEHLKRIIELDKKISLKGLDETDAITIDDIQSSSLTDDLNYSKTAITMCLNQNNALLGSLTVYDKNSFGIYERSGFSNHDKEVFVKFAHQVTKALNRFFVLNPK